MDVRQEAPGGKVARRLFEAYMAEVVARLGGAFDHDAYPDPPADAFGPPRGALLVGRDSGTAVACGGGEIKRMYVVPEARGRGLGRRLLEELEAAARQLACESVRLDTAEPLVEAAALYASAGYRRIPAYNANANAVAWFEK